MSNANYLLGKKKLLTQWSSKCLASLYYPLNQHFQYHVSSEMSFENVMKIPCRAETY